MNAQDDQVPESGIDQDLNTPNGEHNPLTPLPKLQLFAVFATELILPLSVTCIYPFLNQFIRETGITKGDERKTGYYAGIIESAYSFSECLSVIMWGYLSDRLGRRPILLLGPFGLSFTMVAFGCSKQFWVLVVVRCFQGIFTGNIGAWKVIIAELTDPTNIGDAFAWLPWFEASVLLLGLPLIGGVLSNLAIRFPNSVGHIDFLRDYPYFLLCAVARFLSFTAWAVAYIWLKETSPIILAREMPKGRGNGLRYDESIRYGEENSMLNQGEHMGYGTCYSPETSLQSSSTGSSSIAAFMTKPLIIIYLNYALLPFIDMCHFVLLPLMYSTSIPLGGLGLDPSQIGIAMGTFGFTNTIVQFNYLGRMIRQLGPRKFYILPFMAFLNCFGGLSAPVPFRAEVREGGWHCAVLMEVQLASQTGIYVASGAVQVLLVENVSPGGGLATMIDIAQMLSSGLKTIAPAFSSSLFSISLTRQLLGGYLVYYSPLAVTLVGIRLSQYLPEARNKGHSRLCFYN